MTSTPPRSWMRALAVSPWPGPASRVRASERGYRLAMPSPHRNSPAMAGAGEASQPEEHEPGGGDRQGDPQQRDGAPGAAGEPHAAGAARQDAEVETAHRGGGLGGAQPGGGEQFGAEVDRAELDRDADGGHHGQQPAGQRQPAGGGPSGRPGGQRLAPVAQVQAGQDEGGQGQHRPPARRGALEQAEQQRGEHRAGRPRRRWLRSARGRGAGRAGRTGWPGRR